jgi:hypothetical protein
VANVIKDEILSKLRAASALNWLEATHNDDRGKELAVALENEAHGMWRGMGERECSTFELLEILMDTDPVGEDAARWSSTLEG